MKSIIFLLLVVVSLEFVHARGGRIKRCDSEADCDVATECCVARSLTTALRTGVCRDRAFIGDRCSPPGLQLGPGYGKKYVRYCNCRGEKNECVEGRLHGDIEAKAWRFRCQRSTGGDNLDENKPDENKPDENKPDENKPDDGRK